MNDSTTVQRLREVIAAIDRRSPRIGRPGEAAIVRDAADLRAKAIERLAQLDRSSAATTSH
ncbi:MAG TPA: hypothetical protein VMW48_18380 [Vicinamibacterales bacterium]|nr:hypothetical protein [Vicinamibacterales bacterium]